MTKYTFTMIVTERRRSNGEWYTLARPERHRINAGQKASLAQAEATRQHIADRDGLRGNVVGVREF